MPTTCYAGLRGLTFKLVLYSMMLLAIMSCSKDKSAGPSDNHHATAAIGRSGGTIAITDDTGNNATLTIPRGALNQEVTIVLEALSSRPTNPIDSHLFTGIRITPDSLTLNEPAILKVEFNFGQLPQTAILFCFKNPGVIMPLGDDSLYGSTIEGLIYHFSEYGGGNPTSGEGLSQSGEGWNSIPTDPLDWWHIYEHVEAMEKWADMLEDPWDMPGDAQALRDRIADIVELVATRFLNLPIPDPPCDDPAYLLAFFKFYGLVTRYVDGELGQQFDDRASDISEHCFYSGTIDYGHNFVFTGPSYSQIINVTGSVPFHINPYVGSSSAVYGGGSTYDVINGTANDCTIAGSGENRVILSGIFQEDVPGSQYFQVDFDESWYTSSVLTIYCPDEDPQSGSMPGSHNSFTIVFPFHDGYMEEQPFIGQGGTGTYTWTLHITHEPE
jgi:hypothetical protein